MWWYTGFPISVRVQDACSRRSKQKRCVEQCSPSRDTKHGRSPHHTNMAAHVTVWWFAPRYKARQVPPHHTNMAAHVKMWWFAPRTKHGRSPHHTNMAAHVAVWWFALERSGEAGLDALTMRGDCVASQPIRHNITLAGNVRAVNESESGNELDRLLIQRPEQRALHLPAME